MEVQSTRHRRAKSCFRRQFINDDRETKPDPAHVPKKEALKTALILRVPSQTRQYRSLN